LVAKVTVALRGFLSDEDASIWVWWLTKLDMLLVSGMNNPDPIAIATSQLIGEIFRMEWLTIFTNTIAGKSTAEEYRMTIIPSCITRQPPSPKDEVYTL